MELYHLCDFAQDFVQHIEKYKELNGIEKVEIEAIIVSYLNFHARYNCIPLDLYRSDLYEEGKMFNNKIPSKSTTVLQSFNKSADLFLDSDYLKITNKTYLRNTQLKEPLSTPECKARVIIKSFLQSYKSYIPTPAYYKKTEYIIIKPKFN